MTMDIRTEFSKSAICQEFSTRCQADTILASQLALVNQAYSYSYQRSKIIIKHMGEYTLHDIDHIYNVLKIMDMLIGIDNVPKLSTPELMLLLLSAAFHDIGMAPSENEVIAWKKAWDHSPVFTSDEEKKEHDQFRRFLAGHPSKEELILDAQISGDFSKAELIRNGLISDYIRSTHAIRAKSIIEKDWNGKILYKDTDMTVEFAEICFSHNESTNSIHSMDMQYLCGNGEFTCLPLISVILRIADLIDFDAKRTPEVLLSNLAIRSPISLTEWKKHRSIEAWIINQNTIQFHAKCRHPAIESAIHKFCDYIDIELMQCNSILAEINRIQTFSQKSLSFRLPLKVDRSKIETKKDIQGRPEYLYRETKFNLSKNQVIDLLMGTKLYGNPEVALRELLQNSIDACLLRQAMEAKWNNPYNPEIIVKYYTEGDDDILEVVDNGIGMDQNIVDKYYTNIGKSFYTSPDFYDLRASTNAKFKPTSRFGIGILSCFMVSDVLIVDTRKLYGQHSSSDALNLTIEGHDSIFWIRPGNREAPGTTTKLILRKKKHPWEKMSPEDFIKSVDNVIPNPPFKLTIESATLTNIRDQTSFAATSAKVLMERDWEEHDNIRTVESRIDNIELGIQGSVIIGILEKHNKPCASIASSSKTIRIEDENYELDKEIRMSANEIQETSTSISIDDEGNISSSNSFSKLAKSKSRISLHGIEIATTIFPEYWNTRPNSAIIKWPFPMLLVVDICGTRDLDLNSARDQIILSQKWGDFEYALAKLICKQVKSKLNDEYWSELKDILLNSSQSTEFSRAITEF